MLLCKYIYRLMKKRGLLQRLKEDSVICAEGFLFEAERRGYMASGEFVPELVLENPDALRSIHRDFQHAGSDVVVSFTYNGHREKMRVIKKEHLLEPLNRVALQIAKQIGIPIEQIIPENVFWDQTIHGDALDIVEVTMSLEERLGIIIDEQEVDRIAGSSGILSALDNPHLLKIVDFQSLIRKIYIRHYGT